MSEYAEMAAFGAGITDQTLLNVLRTAMLEALVTGNASYAINGRQFTRIPLANIQSAITWLESRIDASSNPGVGPGVVLTHTGSGHDQG
jgi:hypothetical protein